jgi:hypothetical protein
MCKNILVVLSVRVIQGRRCFLSIRGILVRLSSLTSLLVLWILWVLSVRLTLSILAIRDILCCLVSPRIRVCRGFLSLHTRALRAFQGIRACRACLACPQVREVLELLLVVVFSL